MRILNFNIVLRPEPEGGFTVFVPSLPGCITYGKNIDEAKRMAMEAISLYLEILKEEGEAIPSDCDNLNGSVQIKIRDEIPAYA